jgi:hypothetical protein
MENFSIKRPKKIYSLLLTVYIASGVINWLPSISSEIVRSLKYLIFIYILFYEFVNFRFKYPSNFLSPLGFFFVLVSMILGSLSSFSLSAVIDISIPFIVIWIFNFDRDFYFKVFYKASIIISFIGLLSIISKLTGLFDIFSGETWGTYFSEAALAGYSTGYSNSLFLFVVFLVFYHRYRKSKFFSIETFCILIIIISQYISGGRSGLLASLIVFSFGYKISNFYKIIILLLFLLSVNKQEILLQLRIKSEYKSEMNLNDISSGRIESSLYYYNKFFEKPLVGYGFGEKPTLNVYLYEPHIVWLRSAINGGIFYLLSLILVFINIFYIFHKNKKYKSINEKYLFNSLFFSTLVITFLEPNYIIGSVQGEILYWILISLLLKNNNKKKFYLNASKN